MRFLDREEELNFLEEEWERDGASFIPIYGRRRTGKTRLMQEFLKDKTHVYHLASQESKGEQVNSFKSSLAEALQDEFLEQTEMRDWKELFAYMKKHLDEEKKFVIAIDEVTYIIKRNSSFPSYLQDIWDNFLKNMDITLLLCGSLVGFMKKSVLDHSSPLYGRRSGQLHLKPLKPFTLDEVIEDEEKTVQLYSVFGGIPRYFEGIDLEKDFYQIIDSILKPESLFFEEGTFLLGQEFRELGNYNSILKSISQGNTELSDIANSIGMDTRKLSNYLDKLYELGFVKKEKPVTMTKKRYRGYHYRLKDNFLDFWFKFIFPNRSHIEERTLTHSDIREGLKLFISKKFEDVCRTQVAEKYNRVGRWWHKENEIDIVGLNEGENEILFGECKWSEDIDPIPLYHKLKKKKDEVRWNDQNREEEFVLFAKSFEYRPSEDDLTCIELEDMADVTVLTHDPARIGK